MMDVTAVQTMLTPLLTSVTFWLTTPVIVLSFMYWRMTQTEMWKIVSKTPSLDELPLLGTLHLCKRDSRGMCAILFPFKEDPSPSSSHACYSSSLCLIGYLLLKTFAKTFIASMTAKVSL